MPVTRRKFLEKTGATALGAAAAVEARGAQSSAARRGKAPQRKQRSKTRAVNSPLLPKPSGPLSHAVIAGGMIYVSGQVAADPRTGRVVEGGFDEQAVQVFENVKAILTGVGATLSDVARVNVYLSDLGNFAKMNEIYRRYFREDYPARTTVGVQLLGRYMIEVDCVAVGVE